MDSADARLVGQIYAADGVDSARVKLIIDHNPGTGKRDARARSFRPLAREVPLRHTILAVVDGDSCVPEGLAARTAPFFIDPRLGALTTDAVVEIANPGLYRDWFRLRFTRRQIMLSSMGLSRRVLTLTGRKSVFRADLATRSDFIALVQSDHIDHWELGRVNFLTGDDKSTLVLAAEAWLADALSAGCRPRLDGKPAEAGVCRPCGHADDALVWQHAADKRPRAGADADRAFPLVVGPGPAPRHLDHACGAALGPDRGGGVQPAGFGRALSVLGRFGWPRTPKRKARHGFARTEKRKSDGRERLDGLVEPLQVMPSALGMCRRINPFPAGINGRHCLGSAISLVWAQVTGPMQAKLSDLRAVLTQLAILAGANDHQFSLQAQTNRAPKALVVVKGEAAPVTGLRGVSSGLWSALRDLGHADGNRYANPRSARFQPFLLAGDGAELRLQGAKVRGLGMAERGLFAGVTQVRSALFSPETLPIIRGSAFLNTGKLSLRGRRAR
jgi:hypothetical protein